MTDKLNNLVETDMPELGGYYLAGSDDAWDHGLTEGNLYMIYKMSWLLPHRVGFVIDDGGGGCSVCRLSAVAGNGKFFKNPANNQ